MKRNFSTVLVVLVFLAGLSLLLYPTVSNWYNSNHQAQVIVDYNDQVDQMEKETARKLLQQAAEYNAALAARDDPFSMTGEDKALYYSTLKPEADSVMAYIEIPSIGVTLPIRHGTEEDVLQKTVGHLEWSSLPVGGESTHCVLSGHRGLPSSELFTNVDRMEIGDLFKLHVLGEILTYRVDNIAVVEPDDHSLLGITEGEDYVTLLTCTPYGINTHRLLIRGVRMDTSGGSAEHTAPQVYDEIKNVDLSFLIPVALAGLAAVTFAVILISSLRKKTAPAPGQTPPAPEQEPGSDTGDPPANG